MAQLRVRHQHPVDEERGADARAQVIMNTRPSRSRPAPQRISATPAASASFRTVTGQLVAFVRTSSTSVPIHERSTLAALSAIPFLMTAGNVQPTAPVQRNRAVSCATTSPTAAGVDARRRDALPLGHQPPGHHVDRRSLDAAAADVDAEGHRSGEEEGQNRSWRRWSRESRPRLRATTGRGRPACRTRARSCRRAGR